MEESLLLVVLEHIFPPESRFDWELYCLIFHINVRFRQWLASRNPEQADNPWSRCETCHGFYYRHGMISAVYSRGCNDTSELNAIFHMLPTLLLLPEFQQKCRYHLERYGQNWVQFGGFLIWTVFPILFRSRVTPASISLFRMCLLGFRSCVFRTNSYELRSDMRSSWKQLRAEANHSAWADLFHRRQPHQIIAALKAGEWRRIARDSSPTRRKVK